MLTFWSAVALTMTAADPTDRPCDGGPLVGSAACDLSLTPDQRAQYIVSRLAQAEKITLMDNGAAAVPSLGIGAYQWWSEALHGVAYSPAVSFAAPTVCATSFPQVIATAASFNKTLFKMIGQAVGKEARSFYNAGHAGLTYWDPNINLIRDPRWGRGQETPGEDPWHTGDYAQAFVEGLQSPANGFIQAAACCKHYYGYDLDNINRTNRNYFDAIINDQDEADTYLPAFHDCIYNAKGVGIMCSYNSVNGVPSCANGRIMNGIARGEWNFTGYITSDCGAVSDIPNTHEYLPANLTSAAVLNAGMDSDCGDFFITNLASSLGNKTVTIQSIDTALVHLFGVQIMVGMFDPKENQGPFFNYTWAKDANTPMHQQLALEAAEQGTVLAKNTNHVFPLSLSSITSLAVIGPNANATTTMQGNYYGTAPVLVSPFAGFKTKVPNTVFVQGCDVDCGSQTGFAAATAAAGKADATVLVIGINHTVEEENLDRTFISLPGYQNDLIDAVANATNGKPLLVVVMAGGSVDFSIARDNPNVHGIMWVGYPGMYGGEALANVVFGDANPSGRFPHTQYYTNYTTTLNMLDMNWRANTASNFPGRTYRFFSGPVLYPFGYGLSYTNFSYTAGPNPAAVSLADVNNAITQAELTHAYSPRADSTILSTVKVTVENVGTRQSAVSVICFAYPPGGDGTVQNGGMPIKFFVGSEKFHLEPMGTQTPVFSLPVHALSVVNAAGVRVAVLGDWVFSFNDEARVTVSVAA
ncbi:putative beta-D-xylosidase 2 [Diplonema papillatum]|nr:putative beta-D-xylosidase 2 [Diplonema papillatum]